MTRSRSRSSCSREEKDQWTVREDVVADKYEKLGLQRENVNTFIFNQQTVTKAFQKLLGNPASDFAVFENGLQEGHRKALAFLAVAIAETSRLNDVRSTVGAYLTPSAKPEALTAPLFEQILSWDKMAEDLLKDLGGKSVDQKVMFVYARIGENTLKKLAAVTAGN